MTQDSNDYNIILQHKDNVIPKQRTVPTKVDISDDNLTANDNTNSTETSSILPFLSHGSEKALPKYAGRSRDDINEFIFKLLKIKKMTLKETKM